MSLDDFIITCFCLIDEMIPSVTQGKRLRKRGPQPKLADSEVITIEVVGSYLGLSQDKALFAYFQRHYAHFFPALRLVDRTTFVRQASNLWAAKERLWCWIRDEMIIFDPSLSIVDSVPVPICRFARAPLVRPFPRRSQLWQRSCRSTNLLWFSPACAIGLVWGAAACVFGSRQ